MEDFRQIDSFNQFVGLLFSDLYESFPRPFELSAGVYLHDMISGVESSDHRNFVICSCDWLSMSGYIFLKETLKTEDGQAYYQVILTEKGLETIKAVPDGLQRIESFRDRLEK